MTIPEAEKYIQGLKELLTIQEEVDKLTIDQMKRIGFEIQTWETFIKIYKATENKITNDKDRNPQENSGNVSGSTGDILKRYAQSGGRYL